MSTRSNGGIIGPQNRSTSATAVGVWHLFDVQQSVLARNWPGFTPQVPSPPAVGTVTLSGLTATIPYTLGYNGGSAITKITAISVPGGLIGTVTGSPPSASITVSGLSPSTTYSFYVYATNAIGDGAGANSNPVTTGAAVTVTYLVVGGGGGGGASGGGAGGYLANSTVYTTGSTLAVTVGAGGSSQLVGADSVLGSITAKGGGYGGKTGTDPGGPGGSGGGAFSNSGTVISGASGTAGQGNSGGSSASDRGGGGGGAGAAGTNSSGGTPGPGGIGSQSSITGTAVYYAGGGGSFNGSAGGNGGGGAGSATVATAGTANTGGGGGGGNAFIGGAGGSGIVIISVPTASYSGTYTGSPTITTVGADKVLTFTGNGSYTV
jgi:hypothetical protein